MNNLDYKGMLLREGEDDDAEWLFPCDAGCNHGLWIYLDRRYHILQIGISYGRPISLWERAKSIFKLLIGKVYVPDAIDLNKTELHQLIDILDSFQEDIKGDENGK